VQDLLYKPFGFSSKEVGIFNIILTISGLIGSMICARLLDGDTPKYKKLYNVCSTIGLILNGLFLITLPSGVHKSLFGVNLFLYGIFMIPTFSIIFPYVVELTYPTNESVSNGVMLFTCRLGATLFGVIATILAERNFYVCAGFITGLTLLGVLPAFFIEEELRKV
jgi:predicted MFS family arabinose efflux permease